MPDVGFRRLSPWPAAAKQVLPRAGRTAGDGAQLRLAGLRLVLQGRPVLDGVDLELQRGEIHALLGANGSGKSSLAFAVMGCEEYRASGRIWFDGEPIDALPLHERARRGITGMWRGHRVS